MTYRISIPVLAIFLSLGISLGSPVAAQNNSDMAHDGPAMNFLRVSPRLATGGHFTDDGIAALAQQDVSLVIDLRDRPPKDQEERLAAAGIRWINVPVVWEAPHRDDFEAFSRFMSENDDESILVQCQANYRASAMTYLYRVTQEGVPEPEARKDLNAIWTPEGTWEAYIDEILESSRARPMPLDLDKSVKNSSSKRYIRAVHLEIPMNTSDLQRIRLGIIDGMLRTKGRIWTYEGEGDGYYLARFDYRGNAVIVRIEYNEQFVQLKYESAFGDMVCENNIDGICYKNARNYYNYTKNLRAAILQQFGG